MTNVLHPDVFHTPERKIRLLLAGLPFFAGLLSPEGEVLECNFVPIGQPLEARSDWVGRSFETGPWWNYSEESRSDILIMMGQAREGRRTAKERLYRRTDGSMGVMMLTLDPLFAPYGQPDAVLVIAVDVTERRRASETAEHLAHDMAHRLRNSFTIMRLLATQQDAPAAAAHAEPEDAAADAARKVMASRLSLVRAGHDLAFRYLFFEVPIEDIVRTAVGDGPIETQTFAPVSVPSAHVQALLLALGELSLAERPAKVEAERLGQTGLRVIWREGEPRPAGAMPDGLSLQLVDRALAMQVGGTVSMSNSSSGFVWRLDMPIEPPAAPRQVTDG